MIDNQIDKEVTQASCEARFILKQENGKRILYLNLPDGSDELNTIWQTDEYDFTVPDLEVSIDVESLYTALDFLTKTRAFCTVSAQNAVRIRLVSKES